MTPIQLDNLTEDLIANYNNMETELINNIAKKVGSDKTLFTIVDNTQITDWQLQRLKDVKGLTLENAKVIAKLSKKTDAEIDSIFKQAGMENVDASLINKGIKAGVLRSPLNEKQIIENALVIASDKTKTTLNLMNNSILQSGNTAYTKVVNDVSTNVLAGTQTVQQAVNIATKKMVNDGLTGFTASNGAKWNPEAYTSVVIKSNVKNTINEIQDKRIKDCGGDYIEINSYTGARPLCSLDQGDIFSLSGKSGVIEDINGLSLTVRSWSDSTYGEPAGILGINCGHQKAMFVPNISSYNRDVVNGKENDEVYEEKQKQRYLEREIKNAKREKSALQNVGADNNTISKASKKIKDKQVQMKEFIEDTGRTRRPAREQIVSKD